MLPIHNILYPINLDRPGSALVGEVLDLALKLQSRLHFLYVNDQQAGYRVATKSVDDLAERVGEVAAGEMLGQVKHFFAIDKGDLGDAVQRYAKSKNIDLIVVGHRHHGSMFSSLFDTRDEKILDRVIIPVLIIPEKH